MKMPTINIKKFKIPKVRIYGIDVIKNFLFFFFYIIITILIIATIFVVIQLIVVSLIYFDLIDYSYGIFEKIIYYNLIWVVPLSLLFVLVRERCIACKSFETTIDEKKLISKNTGRYYTTGSGDFATSTLIYEHLYEVHFTCNNCSHEYYRYELREDNSSDVNRLSEKKAKKYLKDNGASEAFIMSLVGLYFFLS